MQPPTGTRRATLVLFPIILLPSVLLAARPALGERGARPGPVSWPSVGYPSGGPPLVIGSHGGGCISGAVPLPPEGLGYQAVDLTRRRHFGHPVLVAFIVELGRRVAEQRLGLMLVGDMAQPRGGPMASGHVSHQGGLDVDIWFRLDVPSLPPGQRENIPQPPVVDTATGRPDPRRWTERHAELIRQAALDPRVSRVFVGAAIKRDLCERNWPDRRWLWRVRPWPGHDDHLHIRLHCPPGSPSCAERDPPLPPSEGCTPGDLAPAFAHERLFSKRPPPRPNKLLPETCRAVLRALP